MAELNDDRPNQNHLDRPSQDQINDRWLHWIVPLALVFFAASVVFGKDCPVKKEIVIVNGNSMSPLFKNGQELSLQTGYYNCHSVQRGDVVAFDFSGRKNRVIKKIIGVGGDKFEYRESHVFINGKIAKNSAGLAYQIKSKMLELYAKSYPVIPPGSFLVLGDEPGGSLDSSRYGFIEQKQIVGKIAP